ncbi:MAG TPA: hypothetical protein PLD47_10225 [Aggregatilineales bacterium]|nr:hypothetical protein [Aggregatilineales bacterium]
MPDKRQSDKNEPDLPDLAGLLSVLQRSPKYAGTAESTLRDVAAFAVRHSKTPKEALKMARARLHNIVADYLGDPDYPAAAEQLRGVVGTERDTLCKTLAAQHTSTRERLALLPAFYERIFAVTGVPTTILDLACGLNPLLLPFMGLPAEAVYHAYDIHAARIAFLKTFFATHYPLAHAHLQDILAEPPTITAEVALIFKEVHRFEQRRHGDLRGRVELDVVFSGALNLAGILEALAGAGVPWALVSLPAQGMSGRSDLSASYRHLLGKIIVGASWAVTEVVFPGEIVFCLRLGV